MLRKFLSKTPFLRFVLLYAANMTDRSKRATIAATDGPTFYKRRLWKRFLTPDPAFKAVPLSPEFQRHLDTLREDGIVFIRGFDETAQGLRDVIEELGLSGCRRDDRVTDYEIDVGFASPAVMKMLTNSDLTGLFCNYYGRQAYYREHPLLVGMSSGAKGVDRSSSRVHCDGYRQLTLHLLVKDLSASDTHLTFYKGSHKEPKLDYTRVPENSKLVAGEHAVLGTGQAGTLVLFDSGSGYHSGEYLPGQRILLSSVVTSGWIPFADPRRSDLDVLQGQYSSKPPHVRAMFDRN
jgi:hypothetical protein